MEIPNTNSEMESSNQLNLKFILCISHFSKLWRFCKTERVFKQHRYTTKASYTPSATGRQKQVAEVWTNAAKDAREHRMGLAFLLSECHWFLFLCCSGFQKALPPVIKLSGFLSAGLKGLWVRTSELGKKRCQPSACKRSSCLSKEQSRITHCSCLNTVPLPHFETEPGQMNKGRLFFKHRASCTKASRNHR